MNNQTYFLRFTSLVLLLLLGENLLATIKIINLSTQEPVLVRTTATAYDDIKSQASFHAQYIFGGRRSLGKCPKTENATRQGGRDEIITPGVIQTYTLNTKPTKEGYQRGFLLVSPASATRTKEVIMAAKGIAENIGEIGKQLVDTVKGYIKFEPSAIDTTICNITKIATENVPKIKENIKIIDDISILTKYAADDLFIIIDREKKKTKKDDKEEEELLKPAAYLKYKGDIFELDSMNKYLVVYVRRQPGAKLPKSSSCSSANRFYTLDKEGSDFNLSNKKQSLKTKMSRRSRKFGFNANNLFWCEGKKEKGSYAVKLFQTVKTVALKSGSGLLKDNYRYYIIVQLKDTHNKANTHRNRKALYLSVPCQAVSPNTPKEKICAEYKSNDPTKNKYIEEFVRKLKNSIEYQRNIDETFVKTNPDSFKDVKTNQRRSLPVVPSSKAERTQEGRQRSNSFQGIAPSKVEKKPTTLADLAKPQQQAQARAQQTKNESQVNRETSLEVMLDLYSLAQGRGLVRGSTRNEHKASLERMPTKNWPGVKAVSTNNSLLKINLSNKQLLGSLPSSLVKLKNLVELILSNNNLKGAIPLNLIRIPTLRKIDLRGNNFSNTVIFRRAMTKSNPNCEVLLD